MSEKSIVVSAPSGMVTIDVLNWTFARLGSCSSHEIKRDNKIKNNDPGIGRSITIF